MIVFENVTKIYPGGVVAVRDLSLEIEAGETVVFLGTSGSGKTTMMKMVNRLIEPTSGRILIDSQDIVEQDPIALRRRIGYAIQHIGLFPHMSIAENIGVVPRLLQWPAGRIDAHVDELLRLVGLPPEEYRDRYPGQLSGGQQQRVGVARALAADPPIILMDEPFGALDPLTREQLQNEFLDLESEIKKTIIFVTHDVFEAVKMGDRVAVLDAGCLQQVGTPAELVERPANEFVENFLGRNRFQLFLVTKTLRSILDRLAPPRDDSMTHRPEHFLRARNSFLEAIDLFAQSRRQILPVYEGNRYVGDLRKEQLLKIIAESLEGTVSSV